VARHGHQFEPDEFSTTELWSTVYNRTNSTKPYHMHKPVKRLTNTSITDQGKAK